MEPRLNFNDLCLETDQHLSSKVLRNVFVTVHAVMPGSRQLLHAAAELFQMLLDVYTGKLQTTVRVILDCRA